MATKKKPTIDKVVEATTSLTSVVSNHPIEVQAAASEIIKGIFKSVGLTLEDSARVIKEAHSAVLVTVDKYGEEHEMPDTSNRLKAAMMHMELQGLLKGKGIMEGGTQVNALQVNLILEKLKIGEPLSSKTMIVSRGE